MIGIRNNRNTNYTTLKFISIESLVPATHDKASFITHIFWWNQCISPTTCEGPLGIANKICTIKPLASSTGRLIVAFQICRSQKMKKGIHNLSKSWWNHRMVSRDPTIWIGPMQNGPMTNVNKLNFPNSLTLLTSPIRMTSRTRTSPLRRSDWDTVDDWYWNVSGDPEYCIMRQSVVSRSCVSFGKYDLSGSPPGRGQTPSSILRKSDLAGSVGMLESKWYSRSLQVCLCLPTALLWTTLGGPSRVLA